MNILQLIHKTNPFTGFDASRYPFDPAGWNQNDDLFRVLIEKHRPKLIVEVGTWLGGSALRMADACANAGLPTQIVCVDTWLGALEMWEDKNDDSRYGALGLVNGFPSIYYRFLANVCHAGHSERIVPFPVTSMIAAAWFRKQGITADLVYLDASHEYADVSMDIAAWKPLAGVLFGDDYANTSFPCVKLAVDSFWTPTVTDKGKWIL